MDSHKKLLSILHIAYGALHLSVFLILHLILSTLSPFILEKIAHEDETAAAFVQMIFVTVRSVAFILIVLLPLPSIIGGIALLKNKKWGMVLIMVSGCLSLLSFPIGTALGVYTIWVYLEDRKLNL